MPNLKQTEERLQSETLKLLSKPEIFIVNFVVG